MEADTLGGGAVQLSTLEKMKARGYFSPEKQNLIREALQELQAQRSTRPEPATGDGAG